MRPIDADWLKELYNCKGAFTAAHFRTAIDEQPTLNVVPVRRGRWEKITGMAPPEFHGHYACSICGFCDKRLTTRRHEIDYNFCPNCGADMREDIIEEETL